MATKVYDIAVKTGEYQKDGQTKGRYKNIGVVMKGDDGSFIILDRTFNPAGVPNPENRDTLIASLFEPDNVNKAEQAQAAAPPQQQQAAYKQAGPMAARGIAAAAPQQPQTSQHSTFDDDIQF